MSKHVVEEVADFMEGGGQFFPLDTDPSVLSAEVRQFLDRAQEEYRETFMASYPTVNIPEALDGFIDLAYVAFTGAIRLVGPEKAAAAWDAVSDANLAKVDGRHGEPIINEQTGKIGKPEGWTAPDIAAIVWDLD